MTTKYIIPFTCAISWFACMSITHYYFSEENYPLSHYLILAVGSIFIGYFSNKSWTKRIKSITAPWLEEDPDLDEKVVDKALMNHFINRVIADGGVGYLLSDKLVFIPHNFRGNKGKTLEILFADIKAITDIKYYKIYDTGLVITLFNGRKERFVIDKTTDFYAKLKTLVLK